jgi:hypothetical protein
MSSSSCRECGRTIEALDPPTTPLCPHCRPASESLEPLRPRSLAQLRISGRATAVTLTVAILCGLCVLGFAQWRYVVPGVLAAAAVPFIKRAFARAETAQPLRNKRRLQSQLAWAVLVMTGCIAIMFVRKPDAFQNPQFWAEDQFLFCDARADGVASLLKTHSKGQTFFLQRLIAYVGRPIPPRYAPAFYVFAALAGMLGVAAYVSRARIDGLGQVPRALMAVAPALMFSSGDVFLTLANLHWILAVLTLTILMERDPVTRPGRVLLFVGFAALSLTGPFIVILLPLFLLRALLRRTPCSVALAAVALPCAAWQLFQMQTSRTAGVVSWSDSSWQVLVGRNYIGQLFVGTLADFPQVGNRWYLGALLVVYLLLGIYALRYRDGHVAALLVASVLILASGAFAYRHAPAEISQAGFRYYYVPYVCLTWALLMVAARAWMGARLCASVAVVAILAASLTHFMIPPMMDLHWAESSRFIDGPEPCEIFINPYAHFFIFYEPKQLPPKWEVHMLPDPLPPQR